MSVPGDVFDLYDPAIEAERDLTNEEMLLAASAWLKLCATCQTDEGRTLAQHGYTMQRRMMNQLTRLKHKAGESTVANLAHTRELRDQALEAYAATKETN